MNDMISDIEPILKNYGKITVFVKNYPLVLYLEIPHERRYAACFVANIKYPTFDIDRLLIDKFVRQGDKILDAGANIGLTALLFVQAGASEVVALEPVPDLAARIKDIGCSKIRCEPYALSANRGQTNFYLSTTHNQGSTYDIETMAMFPQVYGEKPKPIIVETISIDELGMGFDIWKLDVEGAEVDAAEGASRHLQILPPRVIIAELYGNKFEKFNKRIRSTHEHAYRACIRKDDYSLSLINPAEYEVQADKFHQFAPTFVFLRSPLDAVD
ncbi:FkbM family methyltransferase [Methylobacterium sp. Leaf94]|uniref:FkbM family methyltransferase n=1 Tax=Methylobacterium sp. Leaf94 TaxID=1736250 RepID=UPI000B321C26|nr:FkbM family methyltransferase [Methylobacterium sp. Leaf94]